MVTQYYDRNEKPKTFDKIIVSKEKTKECHLDISDKVNFIPFGEILLEVPLIKLIALDINAVKPPYYSNIDFKNLDPDKDHEILFICNQKEFHMTIAKVKDMKPSTFFKTDYRLF